MLEPLLAGLSDCLSWFKTRIHRAIPSEMNSQDFRGSDLRSGGMVVAYYKDFICGWIRDANATHIDIIINEARYETHTLYASSGSSVISKFERRFFVLSLAQRLCDRDTVAVRLGDRDLAGSPTVITGIKSSASKPSRTHFHVDFPSGPITIRLCTMSGWITLQAGCRNIRFLVDGRPHAASFTMRADVNERYQTSLAVGWQLTCDIASLGVKSGTLRLTCEIDGLLVAERLFDFQLSPSIPNRSLALFMHIPKTAGTSLSVAVSKQSQLSTYWLYVRGCLPIEDQLKHLSSAAFQDTDLIMGHFPYGTHEMIGCPCQYITFLREPLAFLKSYFFYMKNVQRSPCFQNRDIISAMENRIDPYFDNCFTRYFAGKPVDRVDDEIFDIAIANMERHFVFVGLVERMDESIKSLSRLLGVELESRKENITPSTAEAEAIDMRDFVKRAAPHISYDQKLYKHAQSLFWQ